ncbi:glycosyltransferase family 2 protein [Pseudomonadota bacterium]
MTSAIYSLTILCLLLPIYVYIGYPVLLWLLSKIVKPKTVDKADVTPEVALMVSCYNEADVIREKLDNCLALNYPRNILEIIVISDGSDDGTDEIVKEYEDKGVRLIRQEGRLGKTSGLNLSVAATEAEIVVFSDANAMFDPQAINMLVRNFNDPAVGYVVGAALYTDGDANSAAKSENTYWEYEIFMKQLETQLHSVVGGDGAIYAIRRELYEPLQQQDINDFVNPLQIIAKGYRGIFDADAKCFEETAGNFDKEGRRKRRIVNRSFRGLMRVKEVLNPFKFGFYSLEIISHKLLRWLIPVFILGIAIGSTILAHQGFAHFQLLVMLEAMFLWLAMIGYSKSKNEKISPLFFYPYYFLIVNYHSLLGVIQALQGNIQITWSSPREKSSGETVASKVKSMLVTVTLIMFSIYAFVYSAMRLMG